MQRTDHAPSRSPQSAAGPAAVPVPAPVPASVPAPAPAAPVQQSLAGPNTRVRPGARRRGSGPRRRGPELSALAWQQHGACRTADGAAFFSPDQAGEAPAVRLRRLVQAKRVCASCPVRLSCRSYALENEEEFGVWGGLSETERKHLIAERRG